MSNIFLLGMAVVDFVFHVDSLPDMPQKYRASTASTIGGGGAANAAVAIARLGGKPYLGARLGNDAQAELILADLQSEGVNTTWVQSSSEGRSGYSAVMVDAQGERQIINFRGDYLTENTQWIGDILDIDAVLVDTRWTKGALAALAHARRLGVPAVVDAEAPIPPAIFDVATHIAFSKQGLESLGNGEGVEDLLHKIAKKTSAWCCVTDGANGVYWMDNDRLQHHPAFDIRAVDTLGAGDVWHGVFTLRIAEGATTAEAITFAQAAAALKCARYGGRKAYPRRHEIDTFLTQNLPQIRNAK